LTETWKPINGFSGYEISNLGRVKSYKHDRINGRLLSICVNRNGYAYVVLRDSECKKNYKTIHQLVAHAFISNLDNKPQVNHIDGNKRNNHVSNLEWVTAQENTLHACIIGLRTDDFKEKSVAQLDMNGVTLRVFNSLKEAAEHLNLYNSSHIVDCCKGRRSTCMGYKWQYCGGEMSA
jgi:hypothetical protein